MISRLVFLLIAFTAWGAVSQAVAAPAAGGDAYLSPDPIALAEGCKGHWPRLLADDAVLARLRERLRAEPTLAARFALSLPQQIDLSARGSRTLTPQLAKLQMAAFYYRLTGEKRYRDELERAWPLVRNLIQNPIHVSRPPNANDLDAGWSMRWIALAYDWLRNSDWPKERLAELKAAIEIQAGGVYRELLADRFFAYDQNHGYIPVVGLAMCGFALDGETPEAAKWTGLAHAFMRRTLTVLGGDGFYYEGPSYYDYAFEWIALYGAMLRRVTGENVMDSAAFRNLEFFIAHCTLPGRRFVFDFADWGPRQGQPGYTAPWHSFPTQVSTLPLWIIDAYAQPSPTRSAVLAWLPPAPFATRTSPAAYDGSEFTLLFLTDRAPPTALTAPSMAAVPVFHYFPSHDALFWRSSWADPEATAAYFKAGPPLGHLAAPLVPRFKDWRSNAGHVHPDCANFLIWTRGRFVAGDTGYTAVKWTKDHNTLLIDGQGQVNDGRYHSYRGIDYDRLDRIRLENVWATPEVMAATAVFQDAYAPAFRLSSLRRQFILVAGKWGLIQDEMESAVPHSVTWSWHTDAEPKPVAPSKWHLQNGPAGATLVNLTSDARIRIEPAMVDAYTGVPDHGELLPRGYRLTLTTVPSRTLRMVEALILNSANPPLVQASRQGDGSVVLSDGQNQAVIGMREESDGRVTWTYRLNQGPEIRSRP